MDASRRAASKRKAVQSHPQRHRWNDPRVCQRSRPLYGTDVQPTVPASGRQGKGCVYMPEQRRRKHSRTIFGAFLFASSTNSIKVLWGWLTSWGAATRMESKILAQSVLRGYRAEHIQNKRGPDFGSDGAQRIRRPVCVRQATLRPRVADRQMRLKAQLKYHRLRREIFIAKRTVREAYSPQKCRRRF